MPSCRLALAVLLAAPLAAADDFCIGGTVVNAATGEPINRAAVTTPVSAGMTDASGAYRFCGLPAGSYHAHAEKPGFNPADVRITVGPSRDNLVLRLQPLSVIKGKVTLESNGDPLPNALIQLLSMTMENGHRKAKLENSVATDDRGEYRLPGLATGRYLVRAAGWQGDPSGKAAESSQTFAPVYYGGGANLTEAAPITVDPGGEMTADFSVTLEPSHRIYGRVAGFSAHMPVRIDLLGADGDVRASPATFQASTGTFRVDNVPPGSYTLRATQGEGDQRVRAEQAMNVGAADVHDVLLTLSGGTTVKGVVRVATTTGGSAIAPACTIELSPAGAWSTGEQPIVFSTGEQGEFEVSDVMPGSYLVRMDCAAGYVSAAHAGQTDVLGPGDLVVPQGPVVNLEAVVSTEGGTVDVSRDDDDAAETTWLALVPDSGSEMHLRFAILKGKLSLNNVAPGDYHAYSWTGSPFLLEYANPAARQAWAGSAARVHVGEHDRQSVTVTVFHGDSQ